jgi:hypothetical protein
MYSSICKTNRQKEIAEHIVKTNQTTSFHNVTPLFGYFVSDPSSNAESKRIRFTKK